MKRAHNPTFVGCELLRSTLSLIRELNSLYGGGLKRVKTHTFQKRITVLFMILVMSVAFRAIAQNSNSGEIKGTVTDSSGAVVSGADVDITDILTNITTRTRTNGSGIYDVPSLPTGDYTISFQAKGFRDEIRKGLTLQVGTVAVDAVLQVGTASEQVVVTADVPQLQTEDSAQHITFDEKAVLDAPIVGGVWYNEILNVLPGVNGGGGQDATGQGVGINGTQGYSGTFLIEGSLAQEPRDANASDNYPPPDAIGSVSVQSSNFGAQYGNGVASFNVLVKSGTNKFHGSLFEFNQNDAYDARNYFNNTGAIAPLRWNEFGGSVGGPIVKDKLFFFFMYQRNPNTSSGVYTTTVPTQGQNGTTNMTQGCFPTAITNPATGTPFEGNCISSAMDPVALNIQKYFPAPNVTGLANPYLNNYKVIQTTPTTSTWYVAKVDYNIKENNRLSGSYLDYPIGPLTYNVDPYCSLGFDCTHGNNYNEDGQISDVWTISPTMVNEARIGGVREVDKYIPPTYGKGYPTTIGLEPTYGADAPADIFPGVTINNGGGIGGVGINGGVHADLADGALVESDVFTLIKGKQTIKIGGEFDKSYQNYTSWGDVSSGNFVFDGVATGVPYADFLLGEVYGWYVYDYVETGARMWNMGAFAQDDYKITPHLTLNIGFRYQYQGGWGEEHNRWGTFSPTVVNNGQYANNALGAMLYGGQGRPTIQDGTNEWVPRLGVAWSPVPKWALRASYGISDAPWSVDPYSSAYGIGLNPHGSEGYGNSPAFLLKNGPGPGAVAYPTLSDLSNSQYNYDDVSYFPAKRPVTYYQEILASVQHEMPFQTLVDASYVHTKGTHLGFGRDINQVPEGALSASSTCYNSPTAFPLFCSISASLYDGYSNYDALQLRVEKRTSHGLNFLFNYAWSRTMDSGTGSGNDTGVDVWQNAFDVPGNYGLSTLDTRNSITGDVGYELPFGAGRDFALHGIADGILGGWRLNSVFQVHSGIPFTATTSNNGQDLSGSAANQCGCGFSWLPNVVSNPRVSNPSISEWFNPAAFATPAAGTFGNEKRNTLIGPDWRDMDLSLGKTFRLFEAARFEVRMDSFNVLNHPNFNNPSNATGTGVVGGGTITGANGPRSTQLGGRITF
jgi:outer membrane receptor protein involved in Fe transport